jgi:hypothetical protein
MTTRSIVKAYRAPVAVDQHDVHVRRAMPTEAIESLGPFVFLDHYRTAAGAGVGASPHPHAGIEVFSYLLDGSNEHSDSLGNRDVIAAGDAQFIRAGRGLLHKETPLSARHGLQLWAALPPDAQRAEPVYASFKGAAVPSADLDGARLSVVAGTVSGLTGPAQTTSETVLAHVRLESDRPVRLTVPKGLDLGVYCVAGQVFVGPQGPLQPGDLAVLTPGETIELRGFGAPPVDVAILGGARRTAPLVFSGPFVSDSAEGIRQADADYRSGRMGRLDGVPF